MIVVALFAISSKAMAQGTPPPPNTTKDVELCMNLAALLELRCTSNDKPVINIDIQDKDDWKNGIESNDFSEFEVCATCDWKLECEVLSGGLNYIDELNGNGGKLPLACIGKKITITGTNNNMVNNFALTTPLAPGVTTALCPPVGGSNIGDFTDNTFQIWWGLGQHWLPNMPNQSLLDKKVKAGEYKVKVRYTVKLAN